MVKRGELRGDFVVVFFCHFLEIFLWKFVCVQVSGYRAGVVSSYWAMIMADVLVIAIDVIETKGIDTG